MFNKESKWDNEEQETLTGNEIIVQILRIQMPFQDINLYDNFHVQMKEWVFKIMKILFTEIPTL